MEEEIKEPIKSEFQSRFDPERETVGKIYRDAQINYNGAPILVGDMNNELIKSYVEDLNEELNSDPFNGRPFYVLCFEKRDLQMKNTIARLFRKQLWLPWPEDNTDVWWKDPVSQELRFCWYIPHWTEHHNILNSVGLYERELVQHVKWYTDYKLENFGFVKDDLGQYTKTNPKWTGRLIPKT